MNIKMISFSFFLLFCGLFSSVKIGVFHEDITPPKGSLSAGYASRANTLIDEVKDFLLASSMVIKTKDNILIFTSVDNLGFDITMQKEITREVKEKLNLENPIILIGSTHTHSGGGSFLDYPIIGEYIAGKFDPKMRSYYIDQTIKSIISAYNNLEDGFIGIGFGEIEDMNCYRGKAPSDIAPRKTITVIKVLSKEKKPLGILYNFPCHPTILPAENLAYSADFIGVCRKELKSLISNKVISLFFNGAQGDVNSASKYNNQDDYDIKCNIFGRILAKKVNDIWNNINVSEELDIDFYKLEYFFDIKPTSLGILIPLEKYYSEINYLILNKKHAFLTVPGELSCIYDYKLRKKAEKYFDSLSILGLVNDAHGYILPQDAWDFNSVETTKSFGGREYGPYFYKLSKMLIEKSLEKDTSIEKK